MQIFCYSHLGDMVAARKHYQGLKLLYKRYETRRIIGEEADVRPLTRYIPRTVVRGDIANSMILELPTQWPEMTTLDEVEDRVWLIQLSSISRCISPHVIEWTFCGFEIDNLWKDAYEFADIYRKSADPQAEVKVILQYQKLAQRLRLWKQRDVIVEQQNIERFASRPSNESVDPSHWFFSHQPMYLKNKFFAKMLNQWRALWIYASTILHPYTGVRANIPLRFQLRSKYVKLTLRLDGMGSMVLNGGVYSIRSWHLD